MRSLRLTKELLPTFHYIERHCNTSSLKAEDFIVRNFCQLFTIIGCCSNVPLKAKNALLWSQNLIFKILSRLWLTLRYHLSKPNPPPSLVQGWFHRDKEESSRTRKVLYYHKTSYLIGKIQRTWMWISAQSSLLELPHVPNVVDKQHRVRRLPKNPSLSW